MLIKKIDLGIGILSGCCRVKHQALLSRSADRTVYRLTQCFPPEDPTQDAWPVPRRTTACSAKYHTWVHRSVAPDYQRGSHRRYPAAPPRFSRKRLFQGEHPTTAAMSQGRLSHRRDPNILGRAGQFTALTGACISPALDGMVLPTSPGPTQAGWPPSP